MKILSSCSEYTILITNDWIYFQVIFKNIKVLSFRCFSPDEQKTKNKKVGGLNNLKTKFMFLIFLGFEPLQVFDLIAFTYFICFMLLTV